VPQHSSAVQRVVDAAARKGVQLEVVTFEQSTRTAEDAARAVGAVVGQIVKSLVFVVPGENGPEPCLVLVSGANNVNVERLAAVLTEPRIRRATADEARQLTGFAIGGIPPFGHREPIRTVMDPDLGRFQQVWAAAGTPNSMFATPPATLRMLANAFAAPIVTDNRPAPTASQPEAAAGGGAQHETAGAPSRR
jgi:prolyl-tRNA editing enzyme YbaK/EbsC (Cys-tRNA(Pro) deacylase)